MKNQCSQLFCEYNIIIIRNKKIHSSQIDSHCQFHPLQKGTISRLSFFNDKIPAECDDDRKYQLTIIKNIAAYMCRIAFVY